MNLTVNEKMFLFADIEGSTQLVERIDGGLVDVLADYHRVVDEAVAARGGPVVEARGSGVFAVLDEPAAALEAPGLETVFPALRTQLVKKEVTA